MSNEIEITVKVKDAAQAEAEVAAVGEATKRLGASGSGLSGVSAGIEDIGRSAEDTARKTTLWQDAQGRWRNEAGQFASDAEKTAAGIDDVGRRAEGAGRSAQSSGAGFAFLHSRMMLLSGAAMALGPALAAIPAMAAGAAVGIGTLAGAFTGVIGALHDYAAQQNAVSASGASSAATAFSNALAIRNAEQLIADARKSAAQAAVSSARQIADAQQSLMDAERQAGIAAQSSADQVAAAQQRLTLAQQGLTAAQNALTAAQREGVNTLKDLNLTAEGAANSVVDAQLAVQQAQENATKAAGNSLLTDLQKKQAAQQLVDAQFQLKEAQQKATEATTAATDANARGVDGLAAVVSAHNAVTSATQGVADAQTALARTQQTAANQRINSDESVAKAQQHVADAVQAAAQQQVTSQQQVDRAIQALADTQRQQALAAAAAGASNNKFAADMAKLAPAGRDFVNQVLGMKNGLHELANTAQTATLPGFTSMLQNSVSLFPLVNGAIKTMGGLAGGTAEKFGELMKSPAFQGDLVNILKQAAGFAQQLSDGVVKLVGGVAAAASKAGPIVDGLAKGFNGLLSTGIPDFLKGLTVNAQGVGEAFQSILDLVSGLAGPLGMLIGAVAGSLGPAFRDLVPHVVRFVDEIVQSLLPNMPAFSQLLDSVARILGSILDSLGPLIPLLAGDLKNALEVLNPILGTLAKLLESNHGWLGKFGTAMFELSNPVLIALQALGWLEDHFGSLKETIRRWIADVEHWWDQAGAWLDDKWHKIGEAASKAWLAVYGVTVKPVKDAVDWITGPNGFGAVTGFFSHLPGSLAHAGAGMWDWITSSFKDAINAVIGWWDNLSFKTPSVSWLGIDSMTIGMPHIAPLKAMGGPAGGLTGIGEQGIEMVRLPDGSTVMPHANTMSAIQNGSAGGGGQVSVQLEWVGDHAGDAFFTWLRENIRIRGGNGSGSVQRVLGQAF